MKKLKQRKEGNSNKHDLENDDENAPFLLKNKRKL
jgi:hypothetical protein